MLHEQNIKTSALTAMGAQIGAGPVLDAGLMAHAAARNAARLGDPWADRHRAPSAARRVAREIETRFQRVAVRVGRAAHETAREISTHRRELHRIAWQAVRLLWTVRAAFPWTLRALVVVGCIQIPLLPTDEIAAVVALVWIVARYRPLARVLWHAAVMEAAR